MSKALSPLREYYHLREVLKRVRADPDPDQDDVEDVCAALERRLAKEESLRASNRTQQQRYREAKRREAAE